MNAPVKKPATYADIEALPPNVIGEIINGVLYTQPRPVVRHIRSGDRLKYHITGPFELGHNGPGGWIFMTEPEIDLGPHTVVPDIAGWRADKLPDDYLELARLTVAPDWVCELLSPRTVKQDKGEKSRLYASYSVDYLWFIEPRDRTLEVFVRRDRDWVLHAFFEAADTVAAPPFEAVPFAMSFLWPQKQRTDGGAT